MSATLEIKGVEKAFVRGDRAIQALDNVSLHVEPAQFVCVIGPSGCGKSTLLHIVGGFETPTAGTVLVDGKAVSRPGRDRGMVFQHATLFPWWNIERNVAWPLLLEGQHKQEAAEHAGDLLSLVGLEGFGESYPGELSGGMQQRAALARTLALEPKVLLMDEPFGALDAQTREVMQEELNRIWQEAGITVVFITHDIHEAVFLGDRVVVMSGRPGRFVEDIPIEIPRPRGPEVKNGPEMQAYHAQLWKLIRDEQQVAATA